jgi:hypothetical protein
MSKRLKILIAIVVILVFILIYAWYSASSSKNQQPKAVAPVNRIAGRPVAEEKPELRESKEIIKTLSLLKTVNLDVDFFNNVLFKSLNDFSVQLPLVEPGRENPFAPLE